MNSALHILATGRALPSRRVSNDQMASLVDTSDEWIATRTGIRQRYFCAEGESAATLAARAAEIALARSGIDPAQLCACVVATSSPDYATPSTACLVQRALGLPQDMPCFDISVGCTGFVYGLQVVRGLLLQDSRPYALLVGAEALSRIVDFTDRNTCVLFGDGAGAAVVALRDEGDYACVLGARGDPEMLWAQGPGDQVSALHMDGKGVFRFATQAMPECVEQLLEKSGLTAEDIAWFVPHQANARIVAFAAKRLNLPLERFYQNMDRYGNTSAASIPMALDEMAEQKLLDPGQRIICVGFGAGLTWGGVLLTW